MWPKRNPLLVRPPRQFHGVKDENRILRHGWPDPKIGVHTVTDSNIAAAYAHSSWHQSGSGYPVVVTLDIAGLVIEPDTDAILWWYERGGREQTREALEYLDEYPDRGLADHMNDSMDRGEGIIESVSGYIFRNLEYIDWDAVEPLLPEFGPRAIKGNTEAIREILAAGFSQHRFMVDFDVDRLMEVRTFRPWEDRLVMFRDDGNYDNEPDPDNPGDPDDEGSLAWIEAKVDEGLEVVFEQDADNFRPDWRTLWESPRADSCRKCEYHGMSSQGLVEAFPDLDVPDPDESWRKLVLRSRP